MLKLMNPIMKKLSLTGVLMILNLISLIAQQPWQKFSDISIKEISLNFQSPPPEYGMILWWGWDGPMTDTVIKRDLDRIKEMGFCGVMIEAGYGMTAKYLSQEWFSLVKTAIEQAKIRNMRVWIEDEGKYPSGFAGGKFSTERPDLKMQGLVVTDRIDAKPGEKIHLELPYNTISAAAYNNNDKTTRILNIVSGILDWQVPEGSWKIILAGYRFRSSVTRSVNNPTRGKDTTASLMDYLNPLATRQFLNWTHEEYKKYFGNEFGKTFMGFMGDEPDFAYTPWTPGLAEEFLNRKGYDVKPFLASFFVPELNEETKRAKADYWDVWSDLFRDNFFKVQADWCRENNIEYIVHLNHEDQLPGLTKSSGDYFKNMRYVDVPGVDAIWAQIWMDHVADYPKLASSAAHLFGRPRAFTESFAAYTYRPTVQQAKWVLDYQLVRGINSVQIMFMSASTRKDDSPQSQGIRRSSFFLSDTFPPAARYVNRATYLLSQGRPAARLGLYFPTLSLWYGDNESNASTLEIAKELTELKLDFDFIDEQSLTSILKVDKGAIKNLSGQSYNSIIIPSVSVISNAALSKLRQFASSGGTVIFTGKKPSLLVDKTFRDGNTVADISWAKYDPSGKITKEILNYLPEPDVKTDKPYPVLKYLHRSLSNGELYFFFNEGQEKLSLKILLGTNGTAQQWDAVTGMISTFSNQVKLDNSISIASDFEPYETKFIVVQR
jgi:hypothetical protein